jgi:protein-L-isoaspartate(D-aspartate) O-methyltransferase
MNDDQQREEREALLATIDDEIAATASYTGVRRLGEPVRQALLAVLRHRFVSAEQQAFAYENRPLGIGQGQTISQPYIVALMTELLALKSGDRVLEIGTGSGYQAAVLARLAREVFSVETVPELARSAAAALRAAGVDNVSIHVGDGGLGWPEHAPYDAIIVTAAARRLPAALTEQLKPGGRLVIPIGAPHESQGLEVVTKAMDGSITRRDVLPVAFVPLISGSEAQAPTLH